MHAPHVATEDPDGPRLYEIRLKGHLHDRWTACFAGMTLTRAATGETLLRGLVADQAALHGLLRTIRDLGLPLLSVMQVEPHQANMSHNDAESDHTHLNKETNR